MVHPGRILERSDGRSGRLDQQQHPAKWGGGGGEGVGVGERFECVSKSMSDQ